MSLHVLICFLRFSCFKHIDRGCLQSFDIILNFRWQRTLDPPLIPPSTPAEIFGAHVSEGGSIFPPFQAIFSTSRFSKKTLKINPKGAGGLPEILFNPKSYFFCDLKPHAKFQNPIITPSRRKVTQAEREKESSVTAHASRSDQFLLFHTI